MRKPMVTRTIISTKALALCVNPQTADTFEKVFMLSGWIDDKAKALKKLSKYHNTDDCTIVAVRGLVKVNELYGMDEADFIAGAKILDPATRKEFETEQVVTKTTEQAVAKNNRPVSYKNNRAE